MEKQKVELKLSQIAAIIGGSFFGSDISVMGLSVPENQQENTICMINVQTNAHFVKDGKAAAYMVTDKVSIETDKPVITIKDARQALVKLMIAFYPPEKTVHKISPTACISNSLKYTEPVDIGNFVSVGENVIIGENTRIYHGCFIGDNVKIGKNCIIYPNAVIYEDCSIGDNVIIHAGAVIGADGFGFIPGDNPIKIPQKGTVILEDFVEIGANTCIDRATIGATVIGFGTKLDDLVMVGHNTKLGKACLIASQVGFSGSIEAGDGIVAGGQAGFADHIKIASGSMFGGQTGIPNDVKEKGMYLGTPCMPMIKFAKSQAVFQELPELKRRIINLEKQSNRD